MAESSKNNRFSSSESCNLYYFPEIPSGREKSGSAASAPERFVSGAFNRQDVGASQNAADQEDEKVRCLTEEAFNKGVEQGRRETMAGLKGKVDQATAAMEACVKELLRIRKRDLEQMETETVRLALAIAKKIIGGAIDQGTMIQHVIKAAMEKVNDPRQLVLRLNPRDVDAIRDHKSELFPTDDFGTDWRIEADESIQRGGCIVETKLGDVDARIDRQIRIIEDLLVDQLPKLPA